MESTRFGLYSLFIFALVLLNGCKKEDRPLTEADPRLWVDNPSCPIQRSRLIEVRHRDWHNKERAFVYSYDDLYRITQAKWTDYLVGAQYTYIEDTVVLLSEGSNPRFRYVFNLDGHHIKTVSYVGTGPFYRTYTSGGEATLYADPHDTIGLTWEDGNLIKAESITKPFVVNYEYFPDTDGRSLLNTNNDYVLTPWIYYPFAKQVLSRNFLKRMTVISGPEQTRRDKVRDAYFDSDGRVNHMIEVTKVNDSIVWADTIMCKYECH